MRQGKQNPVSTPATVEVTGVVKTSERGTENKRKKLKDL